MRFNFKKVASILASVAMLGSTAAFAAAANYPAPFVSGSASDVAIVVGATAAGTDLIAAVDIATNLQAALPTTSTTTDATATGGDSLQITKSTNKLNLNNHVTDVWTTKITDSDMPNLLADSTFRSKDNIDYKYEQYLEFEAATVSDINFTHFDDDDYKKDTPALGIKIPSNTKIMNYTIDFIKDPRSDVSSAGRLEDLEDRDITILGKTYKLLNAYNKSSDTKLELMRGAVTSAIALNEEKTVSLDSKSYTVTLTFVDSDETQFTVIDSEGTSQTTNKLVKGGTEKLADGTQIGVTDISYQAFSGGVMSAEFTLGADKLTLENGQVMEVNDEDVNDIAVTITRYEADSNKADIQKIVLQWTADEEAFVAEDSEVVLPGFKSVKITAGAITKACEETVNVKTQGTYGIEMTVPIKDGDAKINLLYGNATDYKFIGGRDDGTNILRTANDSGGDFLRFDRDTDDYFIVSWNSTTEAESYLLRVSSTSDTDGTNYTTIENKVTGKTVAEKKKKDDVITIGSAEFTILYIDHAAKFVDIGASGNTRFDRIYTPGGLGIWLPVNSTIEGAAPVDAVDKWNIVFNDTDGREANGTDANDGSNAYQGVASWMLMMTEEDKDGNIGSGAVINVTLGHASSEAETTEVWGDTATKLWSDGNYREIGSSRIYEGYIASDLGTKVLFNKPNSGTNNVDVEYHCSQLYANIFVSAPDVTISGGGTTSGGSTLGSVTVYDSEVSKVSGKNLIVVGGSCVNTVASKILDGAKCSASFTTATGVGADQALIKVATSPYASDKIAMLVAGYEAADTTRAVKYVTTNNPSTGVGEIKLSTSSTVATVVA